MNSFTAPISLTLGILLGAVLVYRWIFHSSIPANIPRVRDEGKGYFTLRTRLAYYNDCFNLFKEAYEKYSKHGRTCLFPGIGLQTLILLPPSSFRLVAGQPDNVLSVYEGFREMDQAVYTAGTDDYVLHPWQGLLIKWNSNRILEDFISVMYDENVVAFKQRVGQNQRDWTEIPIYETIRRIVAQGVSSFTVGVPLCRNETYLQASLDYGDWFIINAGLLGALPHFLRPLLGPILTVPNRYSERKLRREVKNLYEERRARLDTLDSGKEEMGKKDLFQMMMEYARDHSPQDYNLERLSGRLSIQNFGGMHQTSLAATNVILNVLGSDAEYDTIAQIRAEVEEILAAQNGVWNKGTVAKMVKIDSILRETMRLHAFANRSLIRKVVSPDGFKGEDGITVPPGNLVSVAIAPPQQDPDYFENPTKFDPFRFSRRREATKGGDNDGGLASANGENRAPPSKMGGDGSKLSFVSTGQTFLPFGHGKHACPGRYIADFELKMLLALLFCEYDVELTSDCGGVRPPNVWVAEAMFPPSGAKMRVRRRTSSD